MIARWLAVLLGCLPLGNPATELAAEVDETSFAAQVAPLLKSRCVICHLPGSEQGGLVLHPKGGYANLVDVKSTQSELALVSPGKPEDSYLYRKLTGTHAEAGGSGERMPFGEPSLTSEEIERVRRWIEGGARP